MTVIPLSELLLKDTSTARDELHQSNFLGVRYNGDPVNGMTLSMPMARRLLGARVDFDNNTPIKNFRNDPAKYCKSNFPKWRTVTINGVPSFVFCNMAFMRKHWGAFQVILDSREALLFGDSLGLSPWNIHEMERGQYETLSFDHRRSLPCVVSGTLSAGGNNGRVKKDLEALNKPVLVIKNGVHEKGVLLPLSYTDRLIELGLEDIEFLSHQDLRQKDYALKPNTIYIVEKRGPRLNGRGVEEYILLSPDIDPEIRRELFTVYAEQAVLPVSMEGFNHVSGKSVRHVDKITSMAAAHVFADQITAAQEKGRVVQFALKAPKGQPRPLYALSSTSITNLLTSGNIGIEEAVAPAYADPGKSLNWVLENIGWLCDKTTKFFGGTIFEGSRNLETAESALRSIFACFAEDRHHNALVALPCSNEMVVVTPSPGVAAAADTIVTLRQHGLRGWS